jgi:hypothetical protein
LRFAEYVRRDIDYDYGCGHGLEGKCRQEQQQHASPPVRRDMGDRVRSGRRTRGAGGGIKAPAIYISWRSNKHLVKQSAVTEKQKIGLADLGRLQAAFDDAARANRTGLPLHGLDGLTGGHGQWIEPALFSRLFWGHQGAITRPVHSCPILIAAPRLKSKERCTWKLAVGGARLARCGLRLWLTPGLDRSFPEPTGAIHWLPPDARTCCSTSPSLR